ncbi:MAG TPA: putative sulfate exporter family transporter [Mycobacteriales bacterium]|jgi:uncharacterized integral membrane protein (TIGR00698 family)|nr:putative sulfate exporter family transporter [Mycobacteriales bacterium]
MTQTAKTQPDTADLWVPGLLLSLAVAVVATALGRVAPVVGAPVFGIVGGGLLAAAIRPGERLRPGFAVAGKGVLQASVVVFGTGLSLSRVAHVGGSSLPVLLGTLAVALGVAWLGGRLLGVGGDARTLIGVGSAICGASAIAATTAVIEAAEVDVAYAIGTIFAFNVTAVLLYPALGHALGLSQHAFGLWAGTAINDTSSVVAAGYTYGAAAGSYGVVVKLTRSLMIIPICVALALHRRRKTGTDRPALPWRKLVPTFLIGFVLASALNSVGAIPAAWHGALQQLGVFLITVALSGIGLSLRIGEIRRAGVRPLLLGGLLWASIGLTSLGLQTLLH